MSQSPRVPSNKSSKSLSSISSWFLYSAFSRFALAATCSRSYFAYVLLRIFTNLSVAPLVETGSAVCITTSRISLLVRYVFTSIPLGYFIGTVISSHWRTLRLKSDKRPSCTTIPWPIIILYPIPDSPSFLLTWKRCNIIFLLENSGMQNVTLKSCVVQYGPTDVLHSTSLEHIFAIVRFSVSPFNFSVGSSSIPQSC